MQNRKAKNRDSLNAIRLIMLDWDPMDLFMMGQAGLEEYDEYIPDITKFLKKAKSLDETFSFLSELSKNDMQMQVDEKRTLEAAEKLTKLSL